MSENGSPEKLQEEKYSICGISTWGSWQGLELWFYGATRPSNEDTIIGFFLWYYIVRCEYMKRGVWWKRGGDNGKR